MGFTCSGRRAASFQALVIIALWCGCGSTESAASPTPAAEPAPPVAAEPVVEHQTPPPPPAVAPVDLLHAVPVDLATSSALHRRTSEIDKLVDGDFASSWNSESGDLVGAWIEVRLPAEVRVSSIALTAGHTRVGGAHDLFTSNHRVARVRVLRDGQELGVHALDTESRELQTLPVQGPGGTYRIEIVEVLAGSQRDWREACISELRIMGTADTLHPGDRYPRIGVAVLPAPRPDPAQLDLGVFARALRQRSFDLLERWGEYESELIMATFTSGFQGDEVAVLTRLEQTRQRLLGQVIALVDQADPLAADRLRARGALSGASAALPSTPSFEPDLAAIDAGLVSAASASGDAEAPCRWAKIHTGLLVRRVRTHVRAAIDDIGGLEREFRDDSITIEEIDDMFEDDPRTAIRRLERFRGIPAGQGHHTAGRLSAVAQATRELCWPEP